MDVCIGNKSIIEGNEDQPYADDSEADLYAQTKVCVLHPQFQ
jgi:hypothetical protein